MTATLLVVAQLVLAVVFLTSASAKLLDQTGAREALTGFGVPTRLARPAAVGLPLSEVVVALALLTHGTAWWGAVCALGLLAVFGVAIGVNLARGNTPDCRCFGALSSGPISRRTLVRNGMLAAPAVVIVTFGPGAGILDWLVGRPASDVALIALSLVLVTVCMVGGSLLLGLLRQHGRLLLRIEALEVASGNAVISRSRHEASMSQPALSLGAQAPAFTLKEMGGEQVTLEALRAEAKTRSLLLVFSDPDCGPCSAMMPDVAAWQREQKDRLEVVIISRGELEANRRLASESGLRRVLVQDDREVTEDYRVCGTPSAVVVNSEGQIASRLVQGPLAIKTLVGELARGVGTALQVERVRARNGNENAHRHDGLGAGSPEPVDRRGEPMPPFALHNLRGEHVTQDVLRGRSILVVFWDPACGFCSRILEEIRAWEAQAPEGSLFIVSTGTREANQTLGFLSPVVLDGSFVVGRSVGAPGTPSAVLVDAVGRIAAGVAVGGPAVLELAHSLATDAEPAHA